MRILAPVLGLLLLLPAPLWSRAEPPVAPVALADDGPHVLWTGSTAKLLRWHAGQAEERALAAPWRLELDGLPALTLDPAPPAPHRAVFPRPGRIAAVSDVHGNYPALVALLAGQGIITRDLRWAFGQGHLVVVGDMFDRGGQVTEVLWLVRSLERQAAAAGGAVHALLGNHEAMVLTGDLRYLNPKYRALPWSAGLLYGPDAEQGRWLRALPVMVRLGDVLFVHGGPSPAFAQANPDMAAVNAAARRELDAGKGPVLGGAGPLWYRGLIPGAGQDPEAGEAELGKVLRSYRATAMVLGHSTLEQVSSFHRGRVFGIDAGLKDGKPGELWLQLGRRHLRGLADGRRIPLD